MAGKSPFCGTRHLRFVASDDATGLPVKRRQAQRACGACRKKKRQCRHQPMSGRFPSSLISDEAVSSGSNTLNLDVGQYDSLISEGAYADAAMRDPRSVDASVTLLSIRDAPAEGADSRFVGDMDPKSVLLEAISENHRGPSNSEEHFVRSELGIWRSERAPERPQDQPRSSSNGTATAPQINHHRDLTRESDVEVEVALDRIRPPKKTCSLLFDLYRKKIHPIFPIFDDNKISRCCQERRLFTIGKNGDNERLSSRRASYIDKAIGLAIMVAAACDHEAESYLILDPSSTRSLPYSDFCADIIRGLRLVLQEVNFGDRLLDQIRILALTAFFWQPREEKDRYGPVKMFAEAVAITHSIGLHLKGHHRPNNPSNKTARHDSEDDEAEQLFLCLHTMDRIMAAVCGRPVLMHPRDVDRDIMKSARKQPPCFQLTIYVVDALDKVIDLYRPQVLGQISSRRTFCEVPVFEKLILEAGACSVSPALLATLEVFHHAVAILSLRRTEIELSDSQLDKNPFELQERSVLERAGSNWTLGGVLPQQPLDSHLPEPLLNAQRSVSADRILQVVKEYTVSALPLIPYALSLALSVAYKKWRFSKVAMFRDRGRAFFEDVVPVLQDWGRVFTSARVNSGLAAKVIHIMTRWDAAPDVSGPGPLSTAARAVGDEGSSQDVPLTTMMDANLPSHARLDSSLLPVASKPAPDGPSNFDLFSYFDDNFGMDGVDFFFDQNLDPMHPVVWRVQDVQ